MRNLFSFAFLFAFAGLIITACTPSESKKQAKSLEKPLFSDIKIDSIYPAGLEELQINSSGDTIFGFSYVANGFGPHPTVVLLHGLPGNERNLDVGQHLRRKGFNVIFFDYRGSWGSQGRFTFENSLADTRAVIDFITDSANRTRLRVDPKNIFLLGHSMGAGYALISGIQDERVKGVIGISVFNPYSIFRGNASTVNVMDIGTYVSKLGMLNTTPQQYLKGLLQNVESYNIEQLVADTKKPVLVIDEHDLNEYFGKYSKKKNFHYERWNTDHAFTDKRIALSMRTERWLIANTKRK